MIKAGLDFGNSKISCVVADYKNSTNIDILSLASIPSFNIKKNIILNYDNLFDQVNNLILETEKQSQTKLNSNTRTRYLRQRTYVYIYMI